MTPSAHMSTFSLVQTMLVVGISPDATASTGGSRTTCPPSQWTMRFEITAGEEKAYLCPSSKLTSQWLRKHCPKPGFQRKLQHV